MEDDKFLVGEISFLKPNGFGFIASPDLDQAIYFHATALVMKDNNSFNHLKEGQKVRFKKGQNEKGACAVEIETL